MALSCGAARFGEILSSLRGFQANETARGQHVGCQTGKAKTIVERELLDTPTAVVIFTTVAPEQGRAPQSSLP